MKFIKFSSAFQGIHNIQPRVDHSEIVLQATPEAISRRAWGNVGRNLWGAYIREEEAHSGRKQKIAA